MTSSGRKELDAGQPTGSRGLYVHVPFCDGKCGYCAFYSTTYNRALAERYLCALQIECTQAGKTPPVDTVYVGGGTPTVLDIDQLARLLGIVTLELDLRSVTEWTVEVNPGSVDYECADVLARHGVTRASVGAQSFNDTALRTLGRRHDASATRRTVACLRNVGFTNIGLDLMAAVPGMSDRLWEDTLREAVALGPEHISVYALTSEEGTVLHKLAEHGRVSLPSDDTQLRHLILAEELLAQASYARYEISNYAKPGFECRHNLACWRGAEYVGIGPAAASHVAMLRWTNRPDINSYIAALAAGRPPPRDFDPLTPRLKRTEQIVFGLRTSDGVAKELAHPYHDVLNQLAAKGLLRFEKERWSLTPRGRELADYVATEIFDCPGI